MTADTRALDPGLFRLLNVVSQSQLGELESGCAEWGWQLWRLHGADVVDAASLFARAAKDLPSPFPQRPVHDWDAFTDSLWEAAATTDATEIAFVWTGVERMLEGGLPDLIQAAVALQSLSRRLYSPASPGVPAKALYIFLMGEGPNFPLAATVDVAE